jgi:tRNA (guanine37-N1)-methyltransferase
MTESLGEPSCRVAVGSRGRAGLHVGIVTLFPELFATFLATSFMKRAVSEQLLSCHMEELRLHGLGKHRSVDDTPYGGGAGMVMRVDCLVAAMEHAEEVGGFDGPVHRVLLTPQGKKFDQSSAAALVAHRNLVLVCGRYEGFDERVRHFVHEELSLGDFIMTGGEVAAMAILEATVRLVPGVLGNHGSVRDESFSESRDFGLEYPQYTRPLSFRELDVPEVLRAGDHARIEAYRRVEAATRTIQRRPDLAAKRRELAGES